MSNRAESFPLHRRDVAKTLLNAREDMLVITGLGSTNWDFTAAGDAPRIFPLWGAMGGAAVEPRMQPMWSGHQPAASGTARHPPR